ncbi:MAG: nuclear transport factor 2 family protein [Phenylobacterium sp.]|nr:nuclear transport factor 2 family protein [Phenylobacterium sp.]
MVSREQIAATLRRLNAAENARPGSTVEETSVRLDAVMAPGVHGWRNGAPVPDRAAERKGEFGVFTALPDYHRVIEHMVIDPPKASIGWTIRGTLQGREISAPGSSIFEFDDDGLVRRYWMYADLSVFAPKAAK